MKRLAILFAFFPAILLFLGLALPPPAQAQTATTTSRQIQPRNEAFTFMHITIPGDGAPYLVLHRAGGGTTYNFGPLEPFPREALRLMKQSTSDPLHVFYRYRGHPSSIDGWRIVIYRLGYTYIDGIAHADEISTIETTEFGLFMSREEAQAAWGYLRPKTNQIHFGAEDPVLGEISRSLMQ